MRIVRTVVAICAIAPVFARADGSWPADGRAVMQVLGGPLSLMEGEPGRLVLIGPTPRCVSTLDTHRLGMALGVVTRAGDLVSGGGAEEVVACPGVSQYYGDQQSWSDAVGDRTGNAFAVYTVSGHGGLTGYDIIAMPGGSSVASGGGTDWLTGALLAPMGTGVVSAMWVTYRADDHYHYALRWQALRSNGSPPPALLDTLMTWKNMATCTDGRDGAFVAWCRTDGYYQPVTWIQRFGATGLPAWGPLSFGLHVHAMQPDSAGGVYVLADSGAASMPHVLRLDADGATHPGWPAAGFVLPGGTSLLSDGVGGVLVQAYVDVGKRYFRLLGSGALALGWEAGIPAMSDALPCGDGHGGLYLVRTAYVGNDADLYVTHALSDGTYAGDPSGERFVQASGTQILSSLLPDGDGGFYCAWLDDRSGSLWGYVGHHVADATTPIAFALESARAGAGAIDVAWSVGDRAFAGVIERRTAGVPWRVIADARVAGDGRILVHDADVEGGATYCYRLATGEGGIAGTEVCVTARATPWVTIPPGPVPTRGRLAWTVAADAHAIVDVTLFDIAGRAVLRARVPGGAGAIDVPRGAAAGVYLLELRQGTHALRTRVVLVD